MVNPERHSLSALCCGRAALEYEITPRLASPVPYLGLDLAVHQARPERPSALHLCGHQVCNRLGHSLWNSVGAPAAIAQHASRLAAVGYHRRTIFQPELRVAFLGGAIYIVRSGRVAASDDTRL